MSTVASGGGGGGLKGPADLGWTAFQGGGIPAGGAVVHQAALPHLVDGVVHIGVERSSDPAGQGDDEHALGELLVVPLLQGPQQAGLHTQGLSQPLKRQACALTGLGQ